LNTINIQSKIFGVAKAAGKRNYKISCIYSNHGTKKNTDPYIVYSPYNYMDSYTDDERELKRKTENATDDTKGSLEEMGDKMKAGAKAMGNKMKDPDRDMDTEYNKEKIKEEMD
jgi:hypothetical protein